MDNPELVSERVLCSGRRVVLKQRVYRSGGTEFVRDVVEFGEAVVVVPLFSDGSVVLIRQFRAPVGWILEAPAGVINKGESPEETARRELLEETGLIAGKTEVIMRTVPCPGYSSERLYIAVAEVVGEGKPRREPGELIDVVRMSLDEAITTVLSEDPADQKTLLSLLLVRLIGPEKFLGVSGSDI